VLSPDALWVERWNEKPPEPVSRLAASPFQFAMLFGVAGVIGLALRRLAVARRSPKGDGTRV
jgi:hypothetical protein